MVEVTQTEDIYNDEYKEVLIAGSQFDNDISWFKGCREYYSHTASENLSPAVPDANFFINVTGEIQNIASSGSSVTLSHNVCDDIIETDIHSCSSSYIYWARDFYLDDFGISTDEEFVITSGQVGINKVGRLPEVNFNIYAINDNFPASFSETTLIGSSQYQELPLNIDRNSRIINIDFDTPIVVPAGVERILVEVHKGIVYGDGLAFIAGLSQDTGVSWQRGCISGGPGDKYVSTVDFGRPDAKFYINVTGDVNHVTNNFSMNISNVCSEFLKEFSITPIESVSSIVWNFGDPASGTNNTSDDVSSFHNFTVDGDYMITAKVTATDGSKEVLTETIYAKEPPNANGVDNLFVCEDAFGTGISSSFDVSRITQQILGGQNNMKVSFIDGSGNEYETLPNPFTNTIRDRETIVVRVAHANNPCYYSETTFDLIIHPIPELTSITDLFVCSNRTNGFAFFDLEQVQNDILTKNNAASVSFYRASGIPIQEPLHSVENEIPKEEIITVRVFESMNNCYNETTFKLIVNPPPAIYEPEVLVGCDDNGDGISEYFDTSRVESQVLGKQLGMMVSYFNENGDLLPSPLPNFYTNTIPYEETITIRITDEQTHCINETHLLLRTSTQPKLNSLKPVYTCNLGNGFGLFDLSHIEDEILGGQTGLNIHFFQADGIELPNPLLTLYENIDAWNQTIFVRVENELNNLCYAETSLNLVVNKLPSTDLLEEKYFMCGLEPSFPIQIETDFEYYQWAHKDGTIISNTFDAELINVGNYVLIIGQTTNGKYCEKQFNFELIRSTPPKIVEVRQRDLSSSNFIEIMASGDGDFEYTIDGEISQESNYFTDVTGGNYIVTVRDKKGCGEDSKQVTLIDYPKFFTPNNDGLNDYWQIFGIEEFPDAQVFIFDRYGKLLVKLNFQDLVWDGLFNGREMISNDYWFKANLGNGSIFSGHFTLKR